MPVLRDHDPGKKRLQSETVVINWLDPIRIEKKGSIMNPAPRMSPLCWILLLALGGMAPTGCSRSPAPPETARQTTPRTGGTYSAARQGGGYMHNYYLPPAPSAAPWAPAWAPDGKQIAVGLYGSIWRIDLASREAFELTYDGHYHSSPDWSPDGKWIVYTADHGGHAIQLQILDLETGQSHALTDDSHLYADPVFSPDGNRLAYVSTEPNGYFNIYVRPIREGRWAGPATALTRDHSYGKNRLYFGEWDMHIQPAWTPDGKELLFLSNRGVPLGSGHVWRMPAERPGMARAEPILQEQSLYRTRPHVSHDGKRFIYSSTAGAADQFSHLYVLPINGGAPYKMTFGGYDHFHPRWSPDGERIAYISNRPPLPSGAGLPRLWLMETYGGRKERVQPRKTHWKRPMGILRAEVRDGNTGRKTGARIYGRAADGKLYPPADSYARVSILGEPLFHTGGEFEMTLPPGKMTLEAVKGLEYLPARQEVEIRAGEVSRVSLVLSPLVDMAARGWYGGSTHVHMNYGGNLRNTLENLMFLARAEDQDVVCELIANKDNRILDWDAFVPNHIEHPVSLSDPELVVIVGEEYRPPFHGHVSLLGLRDHLISPFTTGYEGTGIESLYPSNTDMFRKARAQGALVGYVHAYSGETDPLERGLTHARTFPVDAALGTVDTLEWSSPNSATLRVWHHTLNNDLGITPVGGEDAITDLHRSTLPGAFRTYAYLKGKLTAESWLESIRQGKTFISSGPLLDLRIDGRTPGQKLELPAEGGTIRLEATVWSIVPLERVTLYRNGKVLEEFPLTEGQSAIAIKEELEVSESGWFSLTASGPRRSPPLETGYPMAVTNAIRVYVGDGKIRSRRSAEYFMRWIDRLKQQAEEWPDWRSFEETAHVLGQFDEARRIYERLAREADGE